MLWSHVIVPIFELNMQLQLATYLASKDPQDTHYGFLGMPNILPSRGCGFARVDLICMQKIPIERIRWCLMETVSPETIMLGYVHQQTDSVEGTVDFSTA